ncbi:hypothetical protein GH733_013669 [Mirounga leonina]|nr:hypothetical protein GH733_013669 [Mirounga leonina]
MSYYSNWYGGLSYGCGGFGGLDCGYGWGWDSFPRLGHGCGWRGHTYGCCHPLCYATMEALAFVVGDSVVGAVAVAGDVATFTDRAGAREATDMVATAHHAMEDMDSLASTELLLY